MIKQEELITSMRNPKVKMAAGLRQRSHRDEQKLLLVEGCRELQRALDNRRKPVSLFYCEEYFAGKTEADLIRRCREAGAAIFRCKPAVFQKMAYRDSPEGILAVMNQVEYALGDLQLGRTPLIVVAEALEKPGNLGMILRSADAAGADAVIVCDRCTDINNPNVVRASVGTLFSVPVVEASSAETISWLRKHGIQILAATPQADREYTQVDLTRGTSIVVGAEQRGLSGAWLKAANLEVRIPMRGQADSLNVAAAATILLFEALRQRKGKIIS